MDSRKTLLLVGGLLSVALVLAVLAAVALLSNRLASLPEPSAETHSLPVDVPTATAATRVTVVPAAARRALPTPTLTLAAMAISLATEPSATPGETPSPQSRATATSTANAASKEGPPDTPAPTQTASPMPSATDTSPLEPGPTVSAASMPAPTANATPTPTPPSPISPTATNTPVPTSPADASATPSPAPNSTPTPLPSPTATKTAVATATSTASPTATGTPRPTPSPLLATGISGRVLLDGDPVSAGVTLVLEDQAYNIVAETTVEPGGLYRFTGIQPSSQGYNVLFAQERNTQYAINQVVNWGWIGPLPVQTNVSIELPDLDLSLFGLEPTSPEPEATISAGDLSAGDPLVFRWAGYPREAEYWVDLIQGEEQTLVWQSGVVEEPLVAFDGTLDDGRHIPAGDYWWGVGASRPLDSYTFTVYGYLSRLTVEP